MALSAFNEDPERLYLDAVEEATTEATRKYHVLHKVDSKLAHMVFSYAIPSFHRTRDFCIRKDSSSGGGTGGGTSSATDLRFVGNNGKPSSVYPLGLCQGDVSIIISLIVMMT